MPSLSEDELMKANKSAHEATPGPWKVVTWCHKHDVYHIQNPDGGTHVEFNSDNIVDFTFIESCSPDKVIELIRGYRRAAALEDMLREWVDGAVEEWGQELIESMRSACCWECDSKKGHSRSDLLHADGCLVARTEALLAEGDE